MTWFLVLVPPREVQTGFKLQGRAGYIVSMLTSVSLQHNSQTSLTEREKVSVNLKFLNSATLSVFACILYVKM